MSWSRFVNWPNIDQVENGLFLSGLIVEIANDQLLGNELVFRGGTFLHKVHLSPASHYSEDLDYVHRISGEIGQLFNALRSVGEQLGMTVKTNLSEHPKVFLVDLTNPEVEPCESRLRSPLTNALLPETT